MAAFTAPCAIPLSKWLVFICPSLAGFECPLTRPVRTRHQSTLNCRPMATMICLRLDRVVLGLASTGSHLAIGL